MIQVIQTHTNAVNGLPAFPVDSSAVSEIESHDEIDDGPEITTFGTTETKDGRKRTKARSLNKRGTTSKTNTNVCTIHLQGTMFRHEIKSDWFYLHAKYHHFSP